MFFNAFFKAGFVGYKQVVANKLNFFAKAFGKFFPAVPVIFSKAVFNGYNRIFFAQHGKVVNHFFAGFYNAFASHVILAVFIKFA